MRPNTALNTDAQIARGALASLVGLGAGGLALALDGALSFAMEAAMLNSTRIAGLLGPTLIAIAVTEWVNLDVFIAAMGPSYGPHVYQNGTLLFVGGLSIVRAHNHWSLKWPVLITLVGWFALLAGLGRMSAPMATQAASESQAFLYSSLVILLAIGLVLSYKSYVRPEV